MCGLVGIFSSTNSALTDAGVKAFKTMLHLDTVRGDHSTGIMAVGQKDFSTNMVKHVGPPSKDLSFSGNDIFSDFGRIESTSVLMGHNRFATQGEVNVDNAHPFLTEDRKIIGAHNGTIQKYILDRFKGKNKFDTDSEYIFNLISTIGLKETIKQLHNGAYALTWWNAKEKSFNIIRNSERPLYVGKSGAAYIYASEKWMVEIAAARANVSVTDLELLPIHKHFKWDLETDSQLPVTEEVRPTVPTYTYNGYRGYQGGHKNTQIKANQGGQSQKPKVKLSALRPFLDHRVRITAKEIRTDSSNIRYMDCDILSVMGPRSTDVDPNSISVRAYLNGPKRSKDLLEELLDDQLESNNNPYFIECKIKKIKASDKTGGTFYGIVDLRTVESIEYTPLGDINSQEELDLKEQEETTSHAEKHWDRLTSHGCCHCSSLVDFKDSNSVMWVDTGTFFCQECVSKKEHEKYGYNVGVVN